MVQVARSLDIHTKDLLKLANEVKELGESFVSSDKEERDLLIKLHKAYYKGTVGYDKAYEKGSEIAKIILAKALQAQQTREAVRKTREAERGVKKLFGGMPDKLTTCSTKNPEEAELFLAEGDSAGGSCKKARDAKTQAILPVFGKINNVDDASLDDIIKSPKLKDVLTALGCGIGTDFDINNLKYHKIIIAADADK